MSLDRLVTPERSDFVVERVIIAGNRGPCGGVEGGIEAARVLTRAVGEVITNNDVVHNVPIMEELKAYGLRNVGQNWKQLKPDSDTPFLFSTHGHTKEDERIARELGFDTYDSTCALVIRVQLLVERADKKNHFVVYIGQEGHPETMAVMDRARLENRALVETLEDAKNLNLPEDRPAEVFSQTTLMADEVEVIEEELVNKPNVLIHKKKDLCHATLNRQDAVKKLAPRVDMLLVVGSPHSHNSNALMSRSRYIKNGL